MKLETFFEKFELFADAPDAISKMRDLVLRLAFSGGLSGKLPTGEGLPATWEHRTIESIAASITPGFACSRSHQSEDGHVHLRTHNISTLGTLNFDLLVRIDPKMVDPKKASIQAGDILFNNTNSQELVGKTSLVDQDYGYAFSNHITRVRLKAEAFPGFLVYYLTFLRNSGHFARLCTRWINQAAINSDTLKEQTIPLPPLTEQKRIVAKVDELMALCDRLEAQQQERQTRHTALARASLARFADAPTPANLDFLFHKSYSIPAAELRKAILALAVQGTLSNVAPATVEEQTVELNSITHPSYPMSYGVLKPGPHDPDGVRLVKSQHIRNWKVADTIEDKISPALDAEFKRTKIKGGEVLLNLVGASIGRCAIAPASLAGANVSRAVAVITVAPECEAKFVLTLLAAAFTPEKIALLSSGTAQPVLNLGVIRKVRVWVPPRTEQVRIVAKVEQLMSLVDHLEERLITSRSMSEKLTAAIVAELTKAA